MRWNRRAPVSHDGLPGLDGYAAPVNFHLIGNEMLTTEQAEGRLRTVHHPVGAGA